MRRSQPRGGAWGPSQPRAGPLGLVQSFNPLGLVEPRGRPSEHVQTKAGPLGTLQPRAGLLRLVQPRDRPLGPVQPRVGPFRLVEPRGPFGLVQHDARQWQHVQHGAVPWA